jgi:hypothetical protein
MKSERSKMLIAAFLILASCTPLRASAALQDAPAVDHTAVTSQGSTSLPEGDLSWLVSDESILAEGEPVATTGPGFILATTGSLLVSGVARRDSRLAAGESSFLHPDIITTTSNLSESTSAFKTLVVANTPPPEADVEFFFQSQPFAAEPGERELELRRGVVAANESIDVVNGTIPGLIFVERGSVTANNASGDTLELGEGDFGTLTGPITISVASEGDVATVHVAVLGDLFEASPVATPTASAHDISITTYLCPTGVSLEAADPASCGGDANFGVAEFSITGGSLAKAAAPTLEEGRWYWRDLEAGDYAIAIDVYPDGYADYAIDLNDFAAHIGPDILVTYNDESPVDINVYFLDPSA